jgi:hypothetical protein
LGKEYQWRPFVLLREHLGVDLDLDDLDGPPLPAGPLVTAWRTYLASWSAGRRQETLAAVSDFVDLLDGAGGAMSSAFAEWMCGLLFDRSWFWSGQWGGGLVFRDGVWQRPVEPALTAHALSVRVVLPFLLTAPVDESDPRLRWLYQFTVGQGYRLPPHKRHQLWAVIEDRCGVGAAPIELLRHATGDQLAQRMLRDAEGDD